MKIIQGEKVHIKSWCDNPEKGKCLNIIQKIKGKMPKVAIGGKS